MANTINEYQVWDTVLNQWEHIWGSTEPTISPTGHTIDTTKTVIVNSVTSAYPTTDIDGYMIAVHDSAKPNIPNITTYAVWACAGDDMSNPTDVGGGPLLQFNLTPGLTHQTVRIQFHESNGKVWLHQAFLHYMNGGAGDKITGDVVALATPTQNLADLYMDVDSDGYIVPNPYGTGTIGFFDANKISLIPRTFSNDGDWNWNGKDLTPNFTKTGGWKISTIDQTIHRFVAVTTRGSCEPWVPLPSSETTELPPQYALDITAWNESNGTWTGDVMIEFFREKTFHP